MCHQRGNLPDLLSSRPLVPAQGAGPHPWGFYLED